MVRAILDGSKTQTRRAMKRQPHEEWSPEGYTELHAFDKDGELNPDKVVGWGAVNEEGDQGYACPYGRPGDSLWVRETWAFNPDHPGQHARAIYRADPECKYDTDRWTPSIHMPRAACRILLEIVSVRVERLKDCCEADARAEGVESLRGEGVYWRDYSDPEDKNTVSLTARGPLDSYRTLWESINGAGSWDANPWVWVVEFKRMAP